MHSYIKEGSELSWSGVSGNPREFSLKDTPIKEKQLVSDKLPETQPIPFKEKTRLIKSADAPHVALHD